jgi:hypothetical protein
MVTAQLVDFVKRELKKGKDQESLRSSLKEVGWQDSDITEVLGQVKTETKIPSTSPLPPKIESSELSSPQESKETPIVAVSRPIAQPQPLSGRNFFPFLSSGFYQEILLGTKKIKVALLFFILVLVGSFKPSWQIIKFFQPLIGNFKNKVLSVIDVVYPKELEIKIKNGLVSTNVPEPYYLNIPKQVFDLVLPADKKNQIPMARIRLLAIDTKSRAEDFERYQALVLLTKDSLVYYGEENKITIRPLRNIQDLTINKDFLVKKFEEFDQNNRIELVLKIILVVLPLLLATLVISGLLIEISVTSLLVLILVKIKQLSFSLKRVFSFTATVYFLPTFLRIIASQVFKYTLILQTEALNSVIILGLAYSFLPKDQKIKTNVDSN